MVGLLPLASGPACFSNWQKESCQTFEETSGYVRPECVNKWPNSMTDMMMMMIVHEPATCPKSELDKPKFKSLFTDVSMC